MISYILIKSEFEPQFLSFQIDKDIRTSDIIFVSEDNLIEYIANKNIIFIGFSKIEIASIIKNSIKYCRKKQNYQIGFLKKSYNFNFKEIMKNNNICLFMQKNNVIKIFCIENGIVVYENIITNFDDLNDICFDKYNIIFKGLSKVQIASLKLFINSKKSYTKRI